MPKLQELERPKDDADPKALACDRVLVRHRSRQPDQLRLRFVDGRPLSVVTTDFLAWCGECLARQGMTALWLIWDNASWHKSQVVRSWIHTHNQTVTRTATGGRMVRCLLPTTSPWLNPIEPKWVHGKRATAEPDRLLRVAELEARVYSYCGCAPEVHLVIPKQVA